MTDSNLKALYKWFDRLADLPVEAQASELRVLRESGDSTALQLEGLLLCHRSHDPTASPFSIEEILRSCDAQQPFRLASDLRDLSQRMEWDGTKRCFRLAQYSLQQCLSVSAVGATYLAHDEELDRDAVVLFAFPRWNKKPLIPQRILASSRAVAKIFHPNVAAILGTLQSGDVSAVVRQWIPGTNLEEWIGNHPSVSFSDLATIGKGIARGLQAIHDQGVLHGDLKPSNIILQDGGMHPVITDFGTAHGFQVDGTSEWQGGTRGFVAPEILQGSSPTPQSDLYSLGVVLFWMATDMIPHGGDEIESAKAWDRCLNRGDGMGSREGETALGELVLELLASDPGRRPQSAVLVAEALEELQHWGAQPTSSSAAQRVEITTVHSERFHGGTRPLPWKRSRNRRAWMSHAIGLAACAAGSAWMGRLAASQLSHAEPKFWGAKYSDLLVVWDESLFDPMTMAKGSDEPIANGSSEMRCFLNPIAVGNWMTIQSRAIELPAHPISDMIFQFRTHFNCLPGTAKLRVAVQCDGSGPWKEHVMFRNLFGGCYDSPYEVALATQYLRNASSIRVRIGLMALEPPIGPEDLPPVALRLEHSNSPKRMGILIWV